MSVTSDVIKLKNVRLSFPRLFQPKAFQPGQTPRFEATFLLDPSDKSHTRMIKEIKETAKDILNEEFSGKVPWKKIKYCFGDADEEGKEYDGYEGMFFISTANRDRPKVIDRDRSDLDEFHGKPYAGCYVNTNVTLWVQDNEWGKRVNANLRIVQFVRDGEAFGAGSVSADEMDIVDIDDDEMVDDDSFLD